MLPAKLFRSLDAAMQSLRSAGLHLEWEWKSESVGWACVAMYRDGALCELRPADEPLTGMLILSPSQRDVLESSTRFPNKFKGILKFPVSENKKQLVYEFPLDSTPERDLFSNFVEALAPLLDETIKA